MEDLRKLFLQTGKVKEIVICGDLKHEFGKISKQEWDEALALLDFLQENCEKIILVKGNHDKILEPIASKRNLEIVDFYIKGDVCFIHGDREIKEAFRKEIKTIVMGHRHPAVTLQDQYKKETYKCFLVGKWKGKEMIVLPSFFPLVEGSNILNVEEDNLLFIPEMILRNFKVYVVSEDNSVLDFGKLKNIGVLE
jgi:putative SbcD/Mre11-related phosphoesterase